MLELIAQGSALESRWRRPLPEQTVELGRATHVYRTPWDNQISRRHVRLTVVEGKLRVDRIQEAANPVFFNGRSETSFLMVPGEHFVIGKTTFTLASDRVFVSLDVPDPISQKTFSPEFLKQVVYQDADRRVSVLNRLPEIISSAGKTEELLIRIINTLMAGMETALSIGFVRLKDDGEYAMGETAEPEMGPAQPESGQAIEIIQWDRRGLDGGDFQPSERLIREAIQSGETILHIWNQPKRGQQNPSAYTFDYENDWAFACPISGSASPGWGIYVAGTNRSSGSTGGAHSDEPDLQGDIKFCELVGSTLKNLLLVKQLERQNASLGSFFSPIVMEALSGRDPDEVLAPRQCDVSVLFCDLRGFSRTSEQMADRLLELLARVSDSLGIMTRKILEQGGVIGDFHGDSAMGFWGWPLEGSDVNENAMKAVTAAIEISDEFEANLNKNPNFQNFQIGLGIASGVAVAGKIGSRDQVKVSAFGPVVNLASRLEGMTRWVNSEILTDVETVNRLSELSGHVDAPMARRLAQFQPFGMSSSLDVFQLLPGGAISETSLQDYEDALRFFEDGDWGQAAKCLERMPPEDSANQFMSRLIAEQGGGSPKGWDGIVKMQAK